MDLKKKLLLISYHAYHWAKILSPRAIFLKIEVLHPCVQGKSPRENEVDGSNTF